MIKSINKLKILNIFVGRIYPKNMIMKKQILNYRKNTILIMFLLLIVNTIYGQFTVDFVFTPVDPICSGEVISFEAQITNGTGDPEDYTYSWYSDDDFFSDIENPDHTFEAFGCDSPAIFEIKLIVVENETQESGEVTHSLNVKRRPNPQITPNIFDNCEDASYENPEYRIIFSDITNYTVCILKYHIDWTGDGSYDTTINEIGFTNITHWYTELGGYLLTIQAEAMNGCELGVTSFEVKNDLDYPIFDLELIQAPDSDTCAPVTYKIYLGDDYDQNSSTTTYRFDFGDGTPIFSWTLADAMENYGVIEYKYTKSSCEMQDQKFHISITCMNSCQWDEATRTTRRIGAKPIAIDDTITYGACVEDIIYFQSGELYQQGYNSNCGGATNFFWKIEDVIQSYQENFTHSFVDVGTYNGFLEIENYCGSDTAYFQVNIDPQPEASALYNSLEGCVDDFIITFTNTSQGNPISFYWEIPQNSGVNFVNNTGAYSENPEIEFTEKGIFEVKFTVENDCGSDDITFEIRAKDIPEITLLNLPPPPNCVSFTYVNPEATFNASFGNISSYYWEFVGGSPVTTYYVQNPDYVNYNEKGTFPITIKAVNECGEGSSENEIEINEESLITSFPEDMSICKNDTEQFEAYVNNNLASGENWSCSPHPNDITPEGSFTPSYAVNYTITFEYGEVSNNCYVTDNFDVIVNDLPSVNAGDDVYICVGETGLIPLDGDPPEEGTWSGLYVETCASGYCFNPNGVNVGNYTLVFSYQDTETGCEGIDEMTFTIEDFPNPNFSISGIQCVGIPIKFTAPANAIGTTYSWIVSGNTYTGDEITLSFDDQGEVIIELTATSQHADCENTNSQTITIYGIPPDPEFEVSPESGCTPLTVTFIVNSSLEDFIGNSKWMIDGEFYSDEIIPPDKEFKSDDKTEEYVLTWELSNECGTLISDSTTVVVKPLPQSIFGMFPDTICSPDTVRFINNSVGEPTSYLWDFPGFGSSTEKNPPYKIYTTEDTPTIYSISLTTQNDCGENTLFKELVVLPNTIQVGFNYSPREVCVGNPVFFEGLLYDSINIYPSMKKTWDFGDGESSFGVETISHTYDTAGVFNVTLTGDNDCSVSSATHSVTVNPLPDLCFDFYDPVCAGTPVQFNNCSPNTIANLSWDLGGTTSNEINPIHIFESPGKFEVILSGKTPIKGCYDELRDSITVLPTPNPVIMPLDTFGCSPLTLSFSGDPESYHLWDFGDSTPPSNTGTHTFYNNGTSSEIFKVMLTSTNSSSRCMKSVSTNVTVHPTPTSVITFENHGGYPQEVTFFNQSKNFTDDCLWILPDDIYVYSCDDQELVFDQNGIHIIKLITTNSFLCSDTVEIFYEIVLTGLYIPNAFLPESHDPEVNVFKAVGIGLLSYNLSVYDTWGNLVWETNHIENTEPIEGWDGTDKNGQPLPQDVYIWNAHAIFIDFSIWKGQNSKTTGNVTLIR